MNNYALNCRMTLRRRKSCLLVVLFTTIATIFLLIYPQFIDLTRNELDFFYETIDVTGWLVNTQDYTDPMLDGQVWHQLLDTGLIREHDSYSTLRTKIYGKETLLMQANQQSQSAMLDALDALMATEKEFSRNDQIELDVAKAVNRLSAARELSRKPETIRWLAGLDESCLADDGLFCLLPEALGWHPGDLVPIYLASTDIGKTTVCLTVVGVFPGELSGGVTAILPLRTVEVLSEKHWLFYVNSCNFTVADNRKLPELKEALVELGLNGLGDIGVRAAIDDRVLNGTVSPIQSNLALLERLYRFFFLAIAAVGFFLCFLLTQRCKTEYAVMRMLGESRLQVTMKALLEQAALCLLGILLGGVLFLLSGQGRFTVVPCCALLVCYTLGAGLAVLLTVHVDVMRILCDKE